MLNQTDLLYFSGDDANVLPHLAIGAHRPHRRHREHRAHAVPHDRSTRSTRRPRDGDRRAQGARTARARRHDARARHRRGEVHPARPRPHREPARAPAARRPGGVGGRADRRRDRPRAATSPVSTSPTSAPTATPPPAARCRRSPAPRAERPHRAARAPTATEYQRTNAHTVFDPPALEPGTLRVTPLGGLGEIGRNMTVYEYRRQAPHRRLRRALPRGAPARRRPDPARLHADQGPPRRRRRRRAHARPRGPHRRRARTCCKLAPGHPADRLAR